MAHQYEKDNIAALAAEIKEEGLRVFLAESGTHGFFTDEQGDRLVDFESNLGVITYSSNYCRSGIGCYAGSKLHGTGARLYRLEKDNHRSLLDRPMPYLLDENDRPMRYTTVAEHLAYYSSSHYTEV